MAECEHLWKKYLGFADRPAPERQYCTKCGIDKETWLEQQIQQQQATIAAMRCCGNCERNPDKPKDRIKCDECKNCSEWVIAERLVK